MTTQKIEPLQKNENQWFIFVCVLLIFIAIISASNNYYNAHLSPEERMKIAQNKEIEEQKSIEWWDTFVNSTITIPTFLFYALIGLFIFMFAAKSGRGYY